jgi:hypothetical protein
MNRLVFRAKYNYDIVQKRGYRPGPFQWSASGSDTGPSLPHALKVDISALDIRAAQLHAEHQFSFNGRMQKTDPCPMVRCARDDGI